MAHSYKTPIEGEKSSSSNVVDYIRTQGKGCTRNEKIQFHADDYHVEMMNPERKEMRIEFNDINQVLFSEWINHRKIICGTGCGKVILYDVNNRNWEEVAKRGIDHAGENILSIVINPTKSLVAICTQCTVSQRRHINVYNLPSLDTVCGNMEEWDILTFPYTDSQHKLCWLNDSILMECPHSPMLRFWKKNDMTQKFDFHKLVESKYATNICNAAVNLHKQEICALSANGVITFLDANNLTEVTHYNKILNGVFRHVVVNECHGIFITACVDTICILKKDNGCVKTLTLPNSNYICSLRSVGDLITVGTDNGKIYKIDLREMKNPKYTPEILFQASNTLMNVSRMGYPNDMALCMPAIYTHSYNPSGTRLFTGGGHNYGAFNGYYAALWQ